MIIIKDQFKVDQRDLLAIALEDADRRLKEWVEFNQIVHDARKVWLYCYYLATEFEAGLLILPGIAVCVYFDAGVAPQYSGLYQSSEWDNVPVETLTWDVALPLADESWCEMVLRHCDGLYREENGVVKYNCLPYPGLYRSGACIFFVTTGLGVRELWECNSIFKVIMQDRYPPQGTNNPFLDTLVDVKNAMLAPPPVIPEEVEPEPEIEVPEVNTWAEIKDVYTSYVDNLGVFVPAGYIIDPLNTRLMSKITSSGLDYIVCEYNFQAARQAQDWSTWSPVPYAGWGYSVAMAPQRARRVIIPRVRAFGRQERVVPSYQRYVTVFRGLAPKIQNLYGWNETAYIAFLSRLKRHSVVTEGLISYPMQTESFEDRYFPGPDRDNYLVVAGSERHKPGHAWRTR